MLRSTGKFSFLTKRAYFARFPSWSILGAPVLAWFLSGCHSGRSKRQAAPPVTETQAVPLVNPEPVQTPPPAPLSSNAVTPPVAPAPEQPPRTYAPIEQSPPPKPTVSPTPPAQPLEQTVRIKVNADEPKTITQPVALDVKFARKPELEVPLSINVKMPSEAERKIPVIFSVDSSTPLTVPIRFQAEVDDTRGGNRGVAGVIAENTAGPRAIDPADIPMRLLVELIVVAGVIGGFLRSLEARRVLKRRVEQKTSGEEWKSLSFEERVRALDQKYQSMQPGDQMLMLFANILWGILAAALVPACLVVRGSELLVQIKESHAHLLALFGFCLVAATVGAEFIAFAQRALQRAMQGIDRMAPPRSAASSASADDGPGRPRPAPSD